MFMRFVQLRVQPDRMAEFERFYRERVAGALGELDGCLFAGLLSDPEFPSECLSMTLWRSPEDVQRYESGGLYDRLLSELDPFLWRTNEWRIRLNDDLTIQQEPDRDQPIVQVFPVETDSSAGEAIEHAASNMYLRIVSAKVLPDRIAELLDHYEEVIVPKLLEIDGCRYAFGVRGKGEDNEFLSITLWDSQIKAEEYERYGRYHDLLSSIQHLLSSPIQWKMTLNDRQGEAAVSSEDIHVEGYHIVSGTSFGR